MDKDGYCYYVDRKKDIIIKGGVNIAPSQIDDVLISHKASVGYTCIVDKAEPYIMLTPQVTLYRVDKQKLIPEYLLYYRRHKMQGSNNEQTEKEHNLALANLHNRIEQLDLAEKYILENMYYR